MKMKEVCKRTGLTERAVRFYVAEGLVAPESQNVRGRTYIDFSAADVETLSAVAVLRNAGFAVAEIAVMQRDKDALQSLPARAAQRLTEMAETAEKTAAVLASADVEKCGDIVSLAKLLTSKREPKPNFGKLDGVSQQERDKAFEKFVEEEEMRNMKNKKAALMLGAVLLTAAAVIVTLSVTGQFKNEDKSTAPDTEFIEEYPLSELGMFADDIRAYIPQPAEGFSFKTVGVSGIDGSIVTVYTDGEEDICLWGRKLNESEASVAAEMEALNLKGNNASPENRLETIIPGAEAGEYYVFWIESDTVSEQKMADICANGVNILTPWGEETEILP